MREILGHGRTPSAMSAAIELLSRGDRLRSRRSLEAIKRVVSVANQKLEVWSRRDTLRSEYLRAVQTLPRLQQDIVAAIVQNVRTEQQSTGQSWESRYYELSNTQPGRSGEWLETLRSALASIESVVDVIELLLQLADPDTLFSHDTSTLRTKLRDTVFAHADELELGVGEDHVLVPSPGGTAVALGGDDFDSEDLDHLTGLLCLALRHREQSLYEQVAKSFRPNVGAAPLPEPFVIDLTDHEPISASRHKLVQIEHNRLGRPLPQRTRIARLDCGVPLQYYHGRYYAYAKDEYREQVMQLARAALATAAEGGADCVVLPEYFLPSGGVPEIVDIAREKNVVIVSGVEGRTDAVDGDLLNEVVVSFPDVRRLYRQGKLRASIYEPDTHNCMAIQVFEASSIGTFTVLVCSDYREHDVMSEIAKSVSKLDLIIVSSLNSNADQFVVLSKSDAARMYSNVFIANNCTSERGPASATSDGSGAAMPLRISDQMFVSDHCCPKQFLIAHLSPDGNLWRCVP